MRSDSSPAVSTHGPIVLAPLRPCGMQTAPPQSVARSRLRGTHCPRSAQTMQSGCSFAVCEGKPLARIALFSLRSDHAGCRLPLRSLWLEAAYAARIHIQRCLIRPARLLGSPRTGLVLQPVQNACDPRRFSAQPASPASGIFQPEIWHEQRVIPIPHCH